MNMPDNRIRFLAQVPAQTLDMGVGRRSEALKYDTRKRDNLDMDCPDTRSHCGRDIRRSVRFADIDSVLNELRPIVRGEPD